MTKQKTEQARSRLVLAGCLIICVYGAIVGRPPGTLAAPAPTASASGGDVELFAAVIARLRAGEPYYRAMGTELRRRHYSTASVFNWRTPLLYKLLSTLSPEAARALLVILAVGLLIGAMIVLDPSRVVALIGAVVVEAGAVMAVLVPPAVLLAESWAGVLLGLSVCAYERRWWRSAALVGVVALFVRELAAPYAVLCALLALWRRRWQEATVWGAGALAYAVYFGWHIRHVLAARQPGDLAYHDSWMYAGGLPFVLRTLRANAWVLVSPWWVAAAVLALLLAGCARPETSAYLRGTVLIYLVLFLFVGQPFNSYWGLVIAPVWGLLIADGVAAVIDAEPWRLSLKKPLRL